MNYLYDTFKLNNEDRYHVSKSLLFWSAIMLCLTSFFVGAKFAAVFSFFVFCDYYVTLERTRKFYNIKEKYEHKYV